VDSHTGHRKIFLVSALCDYIHGNGGITCVTRITALSVIHYEQGWTAHSAFGIPVQESDLGLESKISPCSSHADLLHHANLIIWEEIPMTKKANFECVDQLLRDIMGNNLPFGGKTFMGLGDFHQVTPVIHGASGPSAALANSIHSSHLWPHFEILHLTIPIHYAGDPTYVTWVDQVRDGITPCEITI
jgi:hypothetical protein